MVEGSEKHIVVIGGGFAGLWAAMGAAKRLDEALDNPDVAITLVNRDDWHAIRVRNYETNISDARLPLGPLLEQAEVELVIGEVTEIDTDQRLVTVSSAGSADEKSRTLGWDRLVLAAGSALVRPDIPGLAEFGFSIDTWDDADRLNTHLRELVNNAGCSSVLIVGAGMTGVELACEMPARLRGLGIEQPRVILADSADEIGLSLGDEARPVISDALMALGVEARPSVSISEIDEKGATLGEGSRIDAATIVWTAGVRPSGLAAMVAGEHAPDGRLRVDSSMQVAGLDGVFAAGDIAAAPTEDGNETVMSCQHGRPMGRVAGYNAASDLIGNDMISFRFNPYVTCLDLGSFGALLTAGYDRRLVETGEAVKERKATTNRINIYPPKPVNRKSLMAAAAPVVQPKRSIP
ncbi:MAG: FAD-dependent oxidoreductase [Pseudomonadota bacterium]|nr:FAD-dependent oxidoreductase [Pseudomonadota bacterium]